MQTMQSIKDVEVEGKRVLLRTSLNVPTLPGGGVGDVFRLMRALPTIEYLVGRGAKVVLVGYLGREGASLAPVAEALQKLIPHTKLLFTDAALTDVSPLVGALHGGECLMLENIRREPGEERNDPELARTLASFADIFVDDAFAEAHRRYASNVGVAALLPSYAGMLMLEEVERLTEALTPPPGALAIVGGAKFETKEPLTIKLLSTYSSVCLGGALANDVLKSRGVSVGASLVSGAPIPHTITHNERLVLPTDVIAVRAEAGTERVAQINDMQEDEQTLDIGPETAASWAGDIVQAPFVLWNGPMGVYEKGFVSGTDMLARAIAEGMCRAVIGGGDTAAALAQFTFDPARVFISTGGGAMLQFLTDGTLPGIEALKR